MIIKASLGEITSNSGSMTRILSNRLMGVAVATLIQLREAITRGIIIRISTIFIRLLKNQWNDRSSILLNIFKIFTIKKSDYTKGHDY